MTPQYAAGFFDGEGNIAIIQPAANGHYLRVGIANTYLEVLELLQAEYGGSILKKKRYQPHHRQGYNLQITGMRAAAFLTAIEPHLIVKRRAARIGLEFVHSKVSWLGRRRIPKEEVTWRTEMSEMLRVRPRREQEVVKIA